MKNLIIYYSRRGQNYVNGSIKNLAKDIGVKLIFPIRLDCKCKQLAVLCGLWIQPFSVLL